GQVTPAAHPLSRATLLPGGRFSFAVRQWRRSAAKNTRCAATEYSTCGRVPSSRRHVLDTWLDEIRPGHNSTIHDRLLRRQELMIYEMRTFDLQPGMVPEFEKRYAAALPPRAQISPLGAFWHTEVGTLNQA